MTTSSTEIVEILDNLDIGAFPNKGWSKEAVHALDNLITLKQAEARLDELKMVPPVDSKFDLDGYKIDRIYKLEASIEEDKNG